MIEAFPFQAREKNPNISLAGVSNKVKVLIRKLFLTTPNNLMHFMLVPNLHIYIGEMFFFSTFYLQLVISLGYLYVYTTGNYGSYLGTGCNSDICSRMKIYRSYT